MEHYGNQAKQAVGAYRNIETLGGAGVGPSLAERDTPPVSLQLNELDNWLNELGLRVTNLEDRLAPVLSANAPKDGGARPEVGRGGASPLHELLITTTSRVQHLAQRLSLLADRVTI